MIYFVRTLFVYAFLKLNVIEEVENYGKIVFIKNNVENGWQGGYISHTPPGSAPGYNL